MYVTSVLMFNNKGKYYPYFILVLWFSIVKLVLIKVSLNTKLCYTNWQRCLYNWKYYRGESPPGLSKN